MSLILHGYWRASGPYRVRIGLALKGLAYEQASVNLAAGQQHKAEYRAVNPQRLVPALDVDGVVLTQSLAILEWLDETYSDPPLLPKSALDRAVVRAMADVVACDIHPINNLRVLRALEAMEVAEAPRQTWAQRWITDGFNVLEGMIARHGGAWSFGDTPTIADCCLIPQVFNAARFGVTLEAWPALQAVVERAKAHPAFIAAEPARQPDAVAS
jgi:maleylacetoacetate isomerase/maleylpyruvate isomerase